VAPWMILNFWQDTKSINENFMHHVHFSLIKHGFFWSISEKKTATIQSCKKIFHLRFCSFSHIVFSFRDLFFHVFLWVNMNLFANMETEELINVSAKVFLFLKFINHICNPNFREIKNGTSKFNAKITLKFKVFH
jgi:hypothetical protein